MSAALLLLFALFAAVAQDTPPPTLRITVKLVQVDAVVTDSNGRHVSDLRPEDFEIRQDGELQKITYFSYTPEAAPPAAAGKAPIGPPVPLAMSSVALGLALPEMLPAQLSTVDLAGQDRKVEAWSEGGPAVRRYHPGQSILYAFMVINPKVKSSTKKPDVVSEMRLFRNGKLLFSGGSNPLNEGWFEDKRVVGGGIVRLGGGLTPGEYLLQVVVTDKLARKKKSQVSQWIDFEVIAAPAS